MPDHPRRLGIIFQKYDLPLFYVTFNTYERRRILAVSSVHASLLTFFRRGGLRAISVGRYVLMPDHLHVFVQGDHEFDLSQWVRMLKRTLSRAILDRPPHWQPGFFDHLIRSSQSYASKWEYVRENPVQARLVARWDEWPFQGEIVPIHRF